VFRSRPDVADRWERGVVGSGLTLSAGKTVRSSRYFSLNSKMFKARGGLPHLLPSIRSTAFGFGSLEDGVGGLSGRWRRVVKDFPCGVSRRLVLEKHFLKLNVKYVVASRRSLTRGHDLRFSFDAISHANLWKREAWYLSLEKEVPLPPSPAVVDQRRIPPGWQLRRVENVTKEMRDVSRGIRQEFINCAWSSAQLTGRERLDEYRDAVNQAPYYTPTSARSIKKRSLLLGLSVANTRRYLKSTVLRDGRLIRDPRQILDLLRPTGKKIWLPAGSFQPINYCPISE